MARVGRPRTLDRPPCPSCGSAEPVVAHGLRTVGGERRRTFRCRTCGVFTPGAERKQVDPAMRAAVRRVRAETGVSYRLLAQALERHLGVRTTHTTVRSWCNTAPDEDGLGRAPCEYLSLLWALRQELVEEMDP